MPRLLALLAFLSGCGGAAEPAAPPASPGSAPTPAAIAPAPSVAQRAQPPASGTLLAADAGGYHTCAIVRADEHRTSGRVLCWGDNRRGQLGDGTFVTRAAPTAVNGVSDAVAIALGDSHSCALHEDATVSCWGEADVGAIGVVASEDVATATRVSNVDHVVAIAAGRAHTCALRDDGHVVCWGDNDRGELGLGRVSASEAPGEVPGLDDVIAIAAGGPATCALRRDGATLCFGENTGQLGLAQDRSVPGTIVRDDQVGWADGSAGCRPMMQTRWLQTRPVLVRALSNASRIAVGEWVSCAIAAGATRCVGNNLFAQLGVENRNETSREIPEAHGAIDLAIGGSEVCVIVAGQTLCWGNMVDEPRPNHVVASIRAPGAVADVPAGMASVVAGDRHACAFGPSGLHCWGNNELEQLGTGVVVNQDVGRIGGIVATGISTGVAHGCGVRTDGTVACWTEQDPVGHAPAAMAVAGIRDAVRVVSGNHHACAISRSGDVDCFAAPKIEEYGGGGVTRPGRAHRIAALHGIADLAIGSTGMCARQPSGEVDCFDGNFDDLAYGSGAPQPIVATRVPGVIAEQVVVGVFFACARLRDRTVSCWGAAQNGMSGVALSPRPTAIAGLTDVIDLSAGGGHVCALRSDGHVRCFGRNEEGELGDGTMQARSRVVDVVGLDDAIDLDADSMHTCALRRGGRIACWGENGAYQLGIGSGPDRPSPQDLPGIAGATAVSAGMIESCVLASDQSVQCWSRHQDHAPTRHVDMTSRGLAVALP